MSLGFGAPGCGLDTEPGRDAVRPWAGARRVRRCPGPRPGVPVAAAGPPRRRRRVGPVAARGLARYLQDVATDDADDAGLSDGNAASGSSARPTSTIVRPPWYHEPVELTTFCSGFGPRWAERRTIITGEYGALVDTVALWVYVDRGSGRPLVLDERLPHHLRGSRTRAPGPRSPRARPTVARRRRAPVAAARQRLRRARPRQQCAVARGRRGRARPLPSRACADPRARSSTAGPSNGGTRSSWPARCQSWRQRVGARGVARRSTARCGSRRPSPWIPRAEPGGRVH